MKMGSFFSGSGGFELAGEHVGIRTVWESEIEPFPMRVTQARFPDAQQLGDICQINGALLEPVDIVTGGSPCQNMSIAGNRTGLDGEQSVLFRQYVRIVKEMRLEHGKPRFMVWENVPGAFSSNKGEDFRCVLTEIVRIAEDGVSIPRPPGGKWKPAGGIMGDGYSVAWRVLDAQYWGVPQRRKRIYLVADFAGGCAGEILFERKSLFRDTAQGRETREETPGSSAQGIDPAVAGGGYRRAIMLESHPQDCRVGLAKDNIVQTLTEKMGTGGGNVPLVMATPKTMKIRCGCEGGGKGALIQENKSATLSCNNDQTVFVPKAYGICSMESNAMKSGNPDSGFYEAETSRTIDCRGGNPGCNQGGMVILDKSPAYAIQGNMIGRADKNGPNGKGVNKDVSFTLTALDRHGVAYAIGRDNVTAWKEKAQTLTAGELPGSVMHTVFPDKSGTMTAKMSKGSGGPAGDECYNLVVVDYIVRRLTPLECGRLQGFPDDWVDGVSDEDPDKKTVQFWMDAWAEWWALVGRAKGIKRPKDEKAVRRWLKNPASDTELYRMWGNGIALPCAQYVFEGIIKVLGVTDSDTQKGDGEDWTMEQKNA